MCWCDGCVVGLVRLDWWFVIVVGCVLGVCELWNFDVGSDLWRYFELFGCKGVSCCCVVDCCVVFDDWGFFEEELVDWCWSEGVLWWVC